VILKVKVAAALILEICVKKNVKKNVLDGGPVDFFQIGKITGTNCVLKIQYYKFFQLYHMRVLDTLRGISITK